MMGPLEAGGPDTLQKSNRDLFPNKVKGKGLTCEVVLRLLHEDPHSHTQMNLHT